MVVVGANDGAEELLAIATTSMPFRVILNMSVGRREAKKKRKIKMRKISK